MAVRQMLDKGRQRFKAPSGSLSMHDTALFPTDAFMLHGQELQQLIECARQIEWPFLHSGTMQPAPE